MTKLQSAAHSVSLKVYWGMAFFRTIPVGSTPARKTRQNEIRV